MGNNRVTFYRNPSSGNVEQLEATDYYPFGWATNGGAKENKYLYNGKELQEELEEYDYGARYYDPVIGRWNGPDLFSEVHYDLTPYNYVMNNPINYTGPFGLDTVGLTTDRSKPPIDPDRDLGLGGELPQININVGPTGSMTPTSSTSTPTASNSTSSGVTRPRVTWGPNANRNVVSLYSAMKQAAGLLNDGVKAKTDPIVDRYRDEQK